MISTRKTLALLVAASTISPVMAAEDEAIIVTATRTAQTADDTLAAVTVITRSDIDNSTATDLPELLSSQTGIDLVSNGGYGKTSSLFIRGANSDHTVVMIDGIKIGSATSGTAALEYLPLEQIERIEIVRGPRSSLYGSEAIGGVIQIFTRKGGDQTHSYATASAGSYATSSLAAGTSGKSGALSYNLQLSQFDSDNIDSKVTENPDRDGYSNTAFNTRLGYQFSNTSGIDLSLLHAEGNSNYDGGFGGSGATIDYDNDFVQQSLGLKLYANVTTNWQTSLTSGQSLDETRYFEDQISGNYYNTQRDTLSWQNDLTLNNSNLLTIGLDQQTDKVDSNVESWTGAIGYDKTERGNSGLFLQHQWYGERNDIIVGARQDDNDAFGQHSTANVAWGYALNEGLRLSLSHGTAFKAPTFNQLYYPGYGVATLKPEESQSTELGLKGKADNTSWGLSLFSTEIDNLIAYNSDTFSPDNIDKATIKGLELEAQQKFANWKIDSSLTVQDPRDSVTDNYLPRRSRASIKLNAMRKMDKWQFGTGLESYSKRYDNKSNSKEVGGYNLINLMASYQVSPRLSLQAKSHNVADVEYQTASGYNSLGRNNSLTVHYSLD